MPIVAIRRREVARRVGLASKKLSAFDEMRRTDSTFPQPVYISSRTPVWLESEIDQWLAERFDQRDSANDNREKPSK